MKQNPQEMIGFLRDILDFSKVRTTELWHSCQKIFMSGNCLALPQFWYYWFPQNKDFLIICAIKQLYNLTIPQWGKILCEGVHLYFHHLNDSSLHV